MQHEKAAIQVKASLETDAGLPSKSQVFRRRPDPKKLLAIYK